MLSNRIARPYSASIPINNGIFESDWYKLVRIACLLGLPLKKINPPILYFVIYFIIFSLSGNDYEIDIISIDTKYRLSFPPKEVLKAVERGVFFELTYSHMLKGM